MKHPFLRPFSRLIFLSFTFPSQRKRVKTMTGANGSFSAHHGNYSTIVTSVSSEPCLTETLMMLTLNALHRGVDIGYRAGR